MARDRLAAQRNAAGWTQEKLAEHLGVERTTVARWEQGVSTPQPWHRRPLAAALQITLHDLAELLDPGVHGDVADHSVVADGLGGSLAATVTQLEGVAVSAGSDEQRRPVLRLLGHAYQAAGDSAFDRLDLRAAAGHFHEAIEIGAELGDADMIATAQTQRGDVARRQRRYATALRRLEVTERHAATASVLTQVKRCQTLARAHAEMGQRRPFEHVIGRAEELADSLSPEHHREGDHSPRGVRLERGHGLTLLGEPEAALVIYDNTAPPTSRSIRERGSFTIIHAQALAAAGHLDEGVALAVAGLELARSYGSARHVSRVQRMYDRLAVVWAPSELPMRELREALAA